MNDSNGSDLVAFLRARLDDDAEQVKNWGCDCLVEGFPASEHGVACKRRVLADVEAKRRVIDRIALVWPESEYGDIAGILQILAQPYADHPDFNPDWRL